MRKPITKAQQILSDARVRVEGARGRVQTATLELKEAEAALLAHLDVYDSLKSALAPKPRKKAEKPAASPAAQKETAPGKEARCGVCYEVESHANHDSTYLSSHKFDAPKFVARAGRKSRTRSASTEGTEFSTQSSEIETVTALSAGAGD